MFDAVAYKTQVGGGKVNTGAAKSHYRIRTCSEDRIEALLRLMNVLQCCCTCAANDSALVLLAGYVSVI